MPVKQFFGSLFGVGPAFFCEFISLEINVLFSNGIPMPVSQQNPKKLPKNCLSNGIAEGVAPEVTQERYR